MGLDTHAARTAHPYGLTDADIDAFDEPAGRLRDSPAGAIPGAHYAALIEHVTGVDVNQEWIPHDIVIRMAATFAPLDWGGSEYVAEEWDAAARLPGEPFPYEIGSIRAFLNVCATRHLALAKSEWTDDDGRFTTSGARSRDPQGLTNEEIEALDAAAPTISLLGSIRGRTIVDLVHHVSGVHLQQEWIEPEVVEAMADAFARCDPEAAIRETDSSWYQPTTEHIDELGAFFRVCAERGLGLYGSF